MSVQTFSQRFRIDPEVCTSHFVVHLGEANSTQQFLAHEANRLNRRLKLRARLPHALGPWGVAPRQSLLSSHLAVFTPRLPSAPNVKVPVTGWPALV
jgi:hypothetical protein